MSNSYIWGNITDQLGELKWLNETLYECEKNGEVALIIGHFPPQTGTAIKGIFYYVNKQNRMDKKIFDYY